MNQTRVMPANQISNTRATTMHRANQSICGIAHIDQVEMTIQIRGNFSATERHRQTCGRSLLPVARTNRKCWATHDYRRALLRKFERSTLCAKLAEAIRTNHVLFAKAHAFHGATLGIRRCQDALGADIHDTCCTSVQRFSHHLHSTYMIDRVVLLTISPPQIRVGGEVIDRIATSNGLAHCCCIANISAHKFDVLYRQMIDLRTWMLQDTHRLIVPH